MIFDFFDFSKKSMKIQLFRFFDFLEKFGFSDFREIFMKILIFRKISKSTFLKSIFDQKFSIFFHDLFFKPLKNHQENPNVKARNPENATRTRDIIETWRKHFPCLSCHGTHYIVNLTNIPLDLYTSKKWETI